MVDVYSCGWEEAKNHAQSEHTYFNLFDTRFCLKTNSALLKNQSGRQSWFQILSEDLKPIGGRAFLLPIIYPVITTF